MMDWIYIAISWILLRWHDLWQAILPGSNQFLGTNWDWILAIVFLVITVRIVLFPVFVKQIRSQRAMQALQPKMKELQAKHKGDQQTLREEMMKLYSTEKVNPLMGCLPMFLQIPVFLGLFHVLQRLDPVQTKNTTLYTWTQDQWDSAVIARIFAAPISSRFADGSAQLQLFGANGTTVKVVAGVLVLIMMLTTFLTSRQMILKTGWSADPQQRMIQKLMLYGIPTSLLLSGWYFPIGVIIYWVTQNLFSLGQQYWVLHKYPPPAMEGAIPVGGKRRESEPEAPRNAFQRFIAPTGKVEPKTANGRAGAGLAGSAPAKAGLFRRKTSAAIEPAAPQVDSRTLAPKPGAKPVRPKQPGGEYGGTSASASARVDETADGMAEESGVVGGADGSTPADTTPTVAKQITSKAGSSPAKKVSPSTRKKPTSKKGPKR